MYSSTINCRLIKKMHLTTIYLSSEDLDINLFKVSQLELSWTQIVLLCYLFLWRRSHLQLAADKFEMKNFRPTVANESKLEVRLYLFRIDK